MSGLLPFFLEFLLAFELFSNQLVLREAVRSILTLRYVG